MDIVIHNGKKFRLSKTNPKYYYADYYDNGKKTKKALHRVIWEETNNTLIPKGFHVHHLDNDSFNNNPSNLAIISASQHLSNHMSKRLRDPLINNAYFIGLDKARKEASIWHKSETGRQFHKHLSKMMWKKKRQKENICLNCNKTFLTYFPTRAKYCTNPCWQQARYKKRIDFVDRKCAYCSNGFSVRKNESTITCSSSCAAKYRYSQK